MGAPRLRAAGLAATAAALIAAGLVVPGVASAVTPVPTALAPDDPNAAPTAAGAGTPIKNVVLTWSALPATSSYQVQVSDENGLFETPAVDATTPFPSYAPSAKLPAGDYAWRVRASGGTWSSTAYFTRGWTVAPTNPQFVGPDPDATTGPVLTWGAVPDASFYEVQFSAVPFGQVDAEAGDGGTDGESGQACYTSNTSFTPYTSVYGKDDGIVDGKTFKCLEFGDGGPYYWRVRARDGVYDPATVNVTAPARACTGVWYSAFPATLAQTPECSEWAYPAVPSFSVQRNLGVVAPGTPTGLDIGPRAGANADPVVISDNPTFSWSAVPGTTFYRVYQSRTPAIDTLDHQWDTTATSLAPVVQEPDKAVRSYWAVQACAVSQPDTDGFVLTYRSDKDMLVNCGSRSPWRSFVKTTPASVQNVPSTVLANGGRTFTWSTAGVTSKPNGGPSTTLADVQGYDLQISDQYGSFTSPTLTKKVDRQGTVAGKSSATLAIGSLPDGFAWRVRGVNSALVPGPWSTPTQVGVLAAATGKITTATGFALNAPIDVAFNVPVDGVSASSLRIVATSSGAAAAGSVAATSSTKFRFTPSGPWTAGESYRLFLTTAVQTVASSTPAVAGTGTVRAATTVDSASSAISKVAGDYGWTTANASDAVGKTYLRSNDKTSTGKRSYVQTKVRGGTLSVYACMGKSSGYAGIYVDGSLKKKVSLYRTASSCGKLTSVTLASGSAHTVRFAALGTKDKKATSTQVRFDAFKVS